MALLPVLLDMVDEIYENLDNPEKTFGDIPLLFVPHGKRRDHGCPRRRGGHGHGPHSENHSHGHGHGSGEGHSDEHTHKSHEHGEKHEDGHRRCGKKEKHHGPEAGHCKFAELRKNHCGQFKELESCPRFARFGEFGCPRFAGKGCRRFAGRECPYKKTSSDDFKVSFDVKAFNPEDISVKVKGREITVDGKHDDRRDEQGFVSRQFTRRFIVPDDYDVDTVATYLDAEGKMTITASKPKPVVDESTERIVPIQRVASVQEEEEEEVGETSDSTEKSDVEAKKDE